MASGVILNTMMYLKSYGRQDGSDFSRAHAFGFEQLLLEALLIVL